MSRIGIYFDEDAMQQGLINALRARRLDVTSALEAGMVNRTDEEHLEWATRHGRVLYTFNVRDYCQLHEEWISRGKEHSGILLAAQQRYSVGEQLRRLLLFTSRTPATQMRSRLEYLSNWRSS